MALRGTDPESNTTEHTLVYEEKRRTCSCELDRDAKEHAASSSSASLLSLQVLEGP